jgi:SAM-dependent methyltransferase
MRVPISASFNPYVNPIPFVRRLSYGRFQAALDLTDLSSAQRAMDFGCWAGYFLPSLSERFSEVWGVDDDSASVIDKLPDYWTILQVARRLCESHSSSSRQVRLTKATGLMLPFRDGYFDVVFCLDTLAHVGTSVRPQVIRELRRVTSHRGQLIFSLPVEIGPIRPLKTLVRNITGKQSDKNTEGYDYRVDLERLRSSFGSCRFRFFPVNFLGAFNPIVLIDCRILPGQFARSSTGPDRAAV